MAVDRGQFKAEAQIARVLTDRIAAINLGEEGGVAIGDRVVVYREYEVDDPSTQEQLGVARLVRVRLSVFQVDPKFSLARTFEVVPQPGASKFLAASQSLFADQPTIRLTSKEHESSPSVIYVVPGEPASVERPAHTA